MANSTLTLTFLRSEILYDVQNYAYVEGDIMPEERQNAKHQVMDIVEDGNVDRANRIISLAFAECAELLYPFTKQAVEETETRNDAMDIHSSYVMTLSIPESFSKTTCDLLVRYIHEYIVYRILSEWMSITKPESYVTWQSKVIEAKDNIISTKSARTKRVRRGLSPF